MKYGLQLFSVRDAAEKDYGAMLQKVAEMGYSFVETAGYFGHSASEIRSMADACGLKISGTHTSGDDVFDSLEATVALHKELGCSDIVIPWADFSTKDAVDSFIDKANRVIPLLKNEGLTLHYHNHSLELVPNADGIVPMDEIIARSDIMLEVDTFWIYNSRIDPVEFIEKHKDRISTVHLKDGIESSPEDFAAHANRGTQNKALGEGNVPVRAILKKAEELGFTVVVESEGLDPTGLCEVKRCIDYLHGINTSDQ
jgi:sugar phosphate isomerase/epimerase